MTPNNYKLRRDFANNKITSGHIVKDDSMALEFALKYIGFDFFAVIQNP